MADRALYRIIQARLGAQNTKEAERKKREQKQKQKQKQKGDPIIFFAYPLMVDYYASSTPFVTSMLVFMFISLIGILLLITGMSIWYYGLADTINDLREMIVGIRWNDVLYIVIFILFMGSLFWVSPYLTRYMENTVTIFTERCVQIKKYLRKDKVLTYEEIAEAIKRRKISIKNGRYYIPYKGGNVAINFVEGEFPSELFQHLEKKCGISLPEEDIRHRAQRLGSGWACGFLGGGIVLVFSVVIGLIIFLAEGVFTWERAFEAFFNPVFWVAFFLVALGLLLKLIFLPSAGWVYRKYRDVMKVSVMPVIVDVLILVAVICSYVQLKDFFTAGL